MKLLTMIIDDAKILEVYRKKVKKLSSSGCYVGIPKDHLGKNCIIIILDERFFR